jgi:hypothetical protein
VTRITNAEQVLHLLRAHLERARNADRKGRGDAKAVKQARPMERMRALNGAGLSDAQLERALISGLLAEEFGPGLANEARFQHIIDEVTHTLRRDQRGRELLAEAIKRLDA